MNAPALSLACCDFASTRMLALVTIDSARELLNGYALETDAPELGIVEAADLLDAARDALTGSL